MVLRILGVRQLLQALITAVVPARATFALGTAADAIHSASMLLLLGALDRRRRGVALFEAGVAAGLARAGGRAARQSRTNASASSTRSPTLTTKANPDGSTRRSATTR